jgi:hypothetical protein
VRPHAHFLVERRFARWTLGILFIMTFTFASSSMAMALIFNCFIFIFKLNYRRC